jgi:hypothetical protein
VTAPNGGSNSKEKQMSKLDPVKVEDRRVANIYTADFVPLLSDGVENGAVLQLNASKPLGRGFHIYRMAAGETTVGHEHLSDEEFVMIEGDIVDHDGAVYGPGDVVWLRQGTRHSSYSPNGCLIAVYLDGDVEV